MIIKLERISEGIRDINFVELFITIHISREMFLSP